MPPYSESILRAVSRPTTDYADTHSEVLDPNHDNKPVTEVISEDDLEMIKKFAVDHAADSEQPMTCG